MYLDLRKITVNVNTSKRIGLPDGFCQYLIEASVTLQKFNNDLSGHLLRLDIKLLSSTQNSHTIPHMHACTQTHTYISNLGERVMKRMSNPIQ